MTDVSARLDSFEDGGQERLDAEIVQTQSQRLILAIDDDDDNLLLTTYALELLGHISITAATGRDAVALAAQRQPDLILLDIRLPDLDGVTVFKQLRENQRTYLIPVIAVTALASPADRQRIIAAGFTGYVAKPFMLEDLTLAVQNAIT